MRKLLILVLVAALVGILISKRRDRDAAAPEGGGPGPELVESRAPSAGAPTLADTVAFLASQAARAPAEPADAGPPAQPKVVVLSSRSAAPAAVPAPHAEPAAPLGEDFARQIEQAGALLAAGKRVEARALLSRLYVTSRGAAAAKLRDLLDRINKELVFTPRCVEGAIVHVVQAGEILSSIGDKYGVHWRMIARLNGMQSDRLSVGQRLKIIEGPASVVVCKSEFRLALFMNGVYVKEYPICIGRDDLTPAGSLVVDTMLVRPRWYKPGGGIIEYGEQGHLLGERWIGFRDEPGANGLGIHGTNEEATIGTKCSNGCLRMRNDDVIELYDFMLPGSHVHIFE